MDFDTFLRNLAEWTLEGIAATVIILLLGNGLGWLPVRIAVALGGPLTLSQLVGVCLMFPALGFIMTVVKNRVGLTEAKDIMQ
jgi:hypothetical protein